MKKTIIILSVMLLIVVLFSAATIAYFTYQETATNIITTGNIKLKLHDLIDENTDFPTDGLDGVMPGDDITKIVRVENIGDNDFYTRIRLKKQITFEDGTKSINFDNIGLNINSTNWEQKSDGWYYYKGILHPGDITENLFDTVFFSGDIGNEYQNAKIEIIVVADAVQSQNNGATVFDAAGWPSAGN